MTLNRRAAKAIALREDIPLSDEAAVGRLQLLEMVGLIDASRALLPDDTRVYASTDVGKAPGSPSKRRPRGRAA